MGTYQCSKCKLTFGTPSSKPKCPKCGSRKIEDITQKNDIGIVAD